MKDPEQEEKFKFCLQESLKVASIQPVLQVHAALVKALMPLIAP